MSIKCYKRVVSLQHQKKTAKNQTKMVNQDNKKFVGYLRVSRKKQFESGLSLENQAYQIKEYCKENLLDIFIEVESGKSSTRPQLAKALALAKETGAILIATKLDRILRSLAILTAIRESKVPFVALDGLNDSELIISIKAAFAEEELRKISERTIAALNAKKKRGEIEGTKEYEIKQIKGTVLGNKENLTPEAISASLFVRQANARENKENKQATELALLYKEKGFTLREIATKLNDMNFKTRRGQSFEAMTVKRLIDRATTTN
jgi:DNA invertase Pin-like site-specific DNA recombinase